MICPCMQADNGYIYRIHAPGCPFDDGSICRSCGADLIHGLIVGMHAQGCELEAERTVNHQQVALAMQNEREETND